MPNCAEVDEMILWERDQEIKNAVPWNYEKSKRKCKKPSKKATMAPSNLNLWDDQVYGRQNGRGLGSNPVRSAGETL